MIKTNNADRMGTIARPGMVQTDRADRNHVEEGRVDHRRHHHSAGHLHNCPDLLFFCHPVKVLVEVAEIEYQSPVYPVVPFHVGYHRPSLLCLLSCKVLWNDILKPVNMSRWHRWVLRLKRLNGLYYGSVK